MASISFEFYVARRYLMARRKQAFISLISLISILGVTLGVMALVVALALMTGMQQELRDRITGSEAHVYVWDIGGGGFENYREEARRLAEFPRVLGAAPSILGRPWQPHGTERRSSRSKGSTPSWNGM